jgi:hypothetical protein
MPVAPTSLPFWARNTDASVTERKAYTFNVGL